MEPAIPDGIDVIDDDWLSQAMGSPVRIAGIDDIGTGVGMIGAIYRATLDGDGPDTVVIKMPGLDETARFTAQILRLNIREVGFYRELAAESPIRVPHCHFGAVDPETHQFVLVLEDVGSYRAVNQIEGMGSADAEQAVDELAAWHAHWWGAADPIVERGTAMSIRDPIYPMLLPPVFSDGWAKVRGAMSVPRAVEMVADGWVEALPHMLGSLGTTPSTLVHGDYRADNMFFDDDGARRAARLPGHRGIHAGGRPWPTSSPGASPPPPPRRSSRACTSAGCEHSRPRACPSPRSTGCGTSTGARCCSACATR